MNKGFFSSAVLAKGNLPKCSKCNLHRRCLSPWMGVSGEGEYRILVVGEAPGADEDKAGEPFVGKAGRYLRRVFGELGVDLNDCLITNAIRCRPPRNVMDARCLEYCRPHLQRTIDEVKPNVILTLGEYAFHQTLPDSYLRLGGGMTKWRGWTIPSSEVGCWVCPTFHPSYILRENEDPVLSRLFREDVEAALVLRADTGDVTFAMWQYPSLEDLRKGIEIILDRKEALSRLADLADAEGILSFDYETTGLKPEHPDQRIWSCAFSLNGEGTWACLIDETMHEALGRVLFSKRLGKVASNLKFEERWTRAVLGKGVCNWVWDTMLAAHCLDNRRMISSLKFQAFVRLGIGVYDDDIRPYLVPPSGGMRNRIEHAPIKSLLLYNGLDALLTYRVMEHQKREMGVV